MRDRSSMLAILFVLLLWTTIISKEPLVVTASSDSAPPDNPQSTSPILPAEIRVSVTSLTTEYLVNPLGVDEPNPRLSWKLQPAARGTIRGSRPSRGYFQTRYQIQVSNFDYSKNASISWIGDTVKSSQSSLVPLFDLQDISCQELVLKSDTHYEWQVTVHYKVATSDSPDDEYTVTSPIATFRTGLLQEEEWKAVWITGGDENNLIRAFFSVPLPIKSHATLFISGIGYYEAYWNGHKIGNNRLDVGWTDYSKRVWYATHDVTDFLTSNEQTDTIVLGVMLGNGWWSCGVAPGTTQPNCSSDNPPQVKLQLQVDGQIVLISNYSSIFDPPDDNSMDATKGPIVYNSLYQGEIYDGRLTERTQKWLVGMENPDDGFDTWDVSEAQSVANQAKLTSQLFEPIQQMSTRPPVSISIIGMDAVTNTTIQVVDFGQNMAGVVRLKGILCRRGFNITLRHAEVLLHPPHGPRNGSLYTDNLRGAKATDVYICNDNPQGESYTPTFTQHGFRYVEVTGLDYPLLEADIEAVELHSAVQQTSSMSFSNPLLNQIQHLCIWGLKSNLMSVPTDCPQRDERRGWMGDAALAAELATYNFGMGAMYTRWLLQIADAQNDDGSFPNYVPALDAANKAGAPNWQSAFPTLLWTLYRYHGDRQILERHHDALVRYYDYLEDQYNNCHGDMKTYRQGFGDWCPPPPAVKSNGHLLGVFALAHDLQLGAEVFSGSPHPQAAEQAERCQRQLSKLLVDGQEFHTAFFNETIQLYGSGLQTEQALALFLGAVPDQLQNKVLNGLVHDIMVTQGGHTTSGIVGIKFLMEVLSILGKDEVALALALQTTYPSWGFMIQNDDEPATTVWELWNGNTASPGMNSRNHIMFGSISSWMYKYLIGIRPSQAGYAHIHIQPKGQSVLSHASARVVTPFGDVISNWYLDNATTNSSFWMYSHSLSLPPGTRTTFTVPFPKEENVTNFRIVEGKGSRAVAVWEDGEFIPDPPGIYGATQLVDGICMELLNGDFNFVATAQKTLHLQSKSVPDFEIS